MLHLPFDLTSDMPRLGHSTGETERIDAMEWRAGIACTAYGLRFGVRVNEPSLLPVVVERLPYRWKPASSPVVDHLYSFHLGPNVADAPNGETHVLYIDDDPWACPSLDYMLEAYESRLRLYVADHSKRFVFVHAGVVGWHGKAIMIPGQSMSGKTTLVARLVHARATYYSDDLAVLDGQGRVRPYLKPLSLREEGSVFQRHVPLEAMNGTPGKKPLPVALVVMSEYVPGAVWQPRGGLTRRFDMKGEPGLSTDLVQGHAQMSAHQTEVPNLMIVPCGPFPPNPAELLGSQRMREWMAHAQSSYDLVVLDAPPILSLADTRMMAPTADHVILVVDPSLASRRLVRQARLALDAVGARVLGVVVNKGTFHSDQHYYYNYYTYYDLYSRVEQNVAGAGSQDTDPARDGKAAAVSKSRQS